jgi:hypothetical protein
MIFFGELALVVDSDVEADARAIFVASCKVANLNISKAATWVPYTKLGAQSRVTAAFRLSAQSQDQIPAEVDAFCARLAENPDGSPDSQSRIHIRYRSGDLGYERMLDHRQLSFTVPRVLWIHFFVQTDFVFQSEVGSRFM